MIDVLMIGLVGPFPRVFFCTRRGSPVARSMPPRKKFCVASPEADAQGGHVSESSATSDGDYFLKMLDFQHRTIPIGLSYQAITLMLRCVVTASFETLVVM